MNKYSTVEGGTWYLPHVCSHGHTHTRICAHLIHTHAHALAHMQKLHTLSVPCFVNDPFYHNFLGLPNTEHCTLLRVLLSQVNCDHWLFSTINKGNRTRALKCSPWNCYKTMHGECSGSAGSTLEAALCQRLSSGSRTDSCHRSVEQWPDEEPRWWS